MRRASDELAAVCDCVRGRGGRLSRALAEQTAGAQQKVAAEMADLCARMSAIEKLLREVE
jgi:hypothetical protein